MPAMHWIRFVKPSRQDFQVPEGANLMQSLLAQKIPVASSCHGDGVCAKCKVRVMAQPTGLTPVHEQERILIVKNGLAAHERISCQAAVQGDVTIDTGYW
jgi:2Fe-2S ferredoxin